MMYLNNAVAVKEAEQRLNAAKKTARLLYVSADIVTSKRFLKWIRTPEARFSWASDELFRKLLKDMMFQVKQATPIRNWTVDTLDLHFGHLAELFREQAGKLEKGYDFTLKNYDKNFVVPRGKDFSVALYKLLSTGDLSNLLKGGDNAFYLWNAFSAIVVYARARDTLERYTGHQKFEKFLSGLNETYLLGGYPHDILAHDADAFRRKSKVVSLLVRMSFCSTYLITEGSEQFVPDEKDFKVIKMSAAA